MANQSIPATAGLTDEQYFKENGGYRLTAISMGGLVALIGGNMVGGYSPWLSLILTLFGVVASIYAGMGAWRLAYGPEGRRTATARPEDAGGREQGGEPGAAGPAAVGSPTRPAQPPKPNALTILRALGGSGREQSAQRPPNPGLVSEGQNALFVKVALGSWLFAGIGCLLLLIAVFRVA